MRLGEEGSSLDTSSGSTRKSTTKREHGHESKRFKLMGGLDLSVDPLDCVR